MLETEPSYRDPVGFKLSSRPAVELTQSGAQILLNELLDSSIILEEEWEGLAEPIIEVIKEETDVKRLLEQLCQLNLLTRYQASRLAAGKTFGLVLGNYRLLDRLASGGMGII